MLKKWGSEASAMGKLGKSRKQFCVVGLDEHIQKLDQLGVDSERIIRESIKAGAGCAADLIRKEIKSIPANEKKRPRGGVRTYEKEALLKGLGISPVNIFDDDFLNAKVGFEGYSDQKLSGKRRVHRWRFEGGHHLVPGEGYIAVPIIARSIAGGAHAYNISDNDYQGGLFCTPNKFVRRALNNNADVIEGAMRGIFLKNFNAIMNKK